MPALEQHTVTDRAPSHVATASSMHQEVTESRKTGNVKPPEQPTNALDAFGQFSIGFGQGLANFTTETVKAAGQAISHPTETINHAIDDTKKTVIAVAKATTDGASYISEKVAHGDIVGVAKDASHTAQTIGSVATASIDHFNHLSAKEKGYVFGHDVAPTVIGTIVAPELIPEGALAAGASKVMSVASTLVKEEGAVAKIAATMENAREHVASISDKMAALNKKMEQLLHKENSVIRAMEDSEGPRDRTGQIAHGRKPSKEFVAAVDGVKLSPGEDGFIKCFNIEVAKVHNMGAAISEKQVFALGTYSKDMNIIRVAEETGYAKNLKPNRDIAHTLHHEIGHAVNYWLGRLADPERPFKYISDIEHFAKQFDEDLAKNTDAAKTAKAVLTHLFGNDVQAQRDEAFAVMFAHSFCPSTTEYAKNMLEAFGGYYKLVDEFRRANKL